MLKAETDHQSFGTTAAVLGHGHLGRSPPHGWGGIRHERFIRLPRPERRSSSAIVRGAAGPARSARTSSHPT